MAEILTLPNSAGTPVTYTINTAAEITAHVAKVAGSHRIVVFATSDAVATQIYQHLVAAFSGVCLVTKTMRSRLSYGILDVFGTPACQILVVTDGALTEIPVAAPTEVLHGDRPASLEAAATVLARRLRR